MEKVRDVAYRNSITGTRIVLSKDGVDRYNHVADSLEKRKDVDGIAVEVIGQAYESGYNEGYDGGEKDGMMKGAGLGAAVAAIAVAAITHPEETRELAKKGFKWTKEKSAAAFNWAKNKFKKEENDPVDVEFNEV